MRLTQACEILRDIKNELNEMGVKLDYETSIENLVELGCSKKIARMSYDIIIKEA